MKANSRQTPLYHLFEHERPPAQAFCSVNSDPSLIFLYRQVRDHSFRQNRITLQLSPKHEWDLVMYSAKKYARMGCDSLALDLGELNTG